MAATAFATVSTNAGRNEYTATAGQTVFNYTFKIYADTDLSVYITASGATPNDSTDITTAYTVAGAGEDAGGSITLDSGATLDDAVTIVSAIPTSRTVDYQFNGDFRPDVVNNDFDRAVSLVKQIEDANVNALRYQNSVQGAPGFLVAPAAGNVIGYDGSGNLANFDLAVDGNSWDGLADLISSDVGKGSDLVAHTATVRTVTETLDGYDDGTVALAAPAVTSFANSTHDHADAAGGGNTLTIPTIANYTNATHDHSNAANGGALVEVVEVAAITDGDTTPSVVGASAFTVPNGASYAITTFNDGIEGQVIRLLFLSTTGKVDLVDGATLVLAGGADWTNTSVGDTAIFILISSVWYELSRSVN
jgi:hypothetical protein